MLVGAGLDEGELDEPGAPVDVPVDVPVLDWPDWVEDVREALTLLVLLAPPEPVNERVEVSNVNDVVAAGKERAVKRKCQ